MKQRNYIFICKAGHDRSPSAVKVAEDICKKKGLEAIFTFGGIDSLEDNVGDLRGYLDFFDGIFVMEERISVCVFKLWNKCF